MHKKGLKNEKNLKNIACLPKHEVILIIWDIKSKKRLLRNIQNSPEQVLIDYES
jgi:hypothetical protein